MISRTLDVLKCLALAGILVSWLWDLPPLGVVSCLALITAQALIMLFVLTVTQRILADASSKELAAGISAEALTLRRLVLPRAYAVIILAILLLTFHVTSPTPKLAAWFIPGLAILTTLAGIYSSFAEFFAFRLLAALQQRVATMLGVAIITE